MKIYLDNCCFNRPYDDQSQAKIHIESQAKLCIQERVRSGKYDLVWSYILEYENAQNPFEMRRISILKWKAIAKEMVFSDDVLLNYARQLMLMGIKAKDALHVACAVKAGCDVFLTTDLKLLNKPVTDIKLMNPVSFVIEFE